MFTAWGPSQDQTAIVKGITSVSTASHGGYYLSPERNDQVPEYMRREDNWYEEDCDWAIPCLVFSEEFLAFARKEAGLIAYTDGTEQQRAAKITLRNWRPEAFEKFFNVVLLPGESRMRDRFIFDMNHRDEFLGVAGYGDWHKSVPQGFVGVYAERTHPEAEGHFLVPVKEYRAREAHPFLINEKRHDVWIQHP